MKAQQPNNGYTTKVAFRNAARQMKSLAETLEGLCVVLQADERRKTQDLADDMLSTVYGLQKQLVAAHRQLKQESEATQ